MAKQIIDIGTLNDDNTGDSIRVGGDKINDNFTELYTLSAGSIGGSIIDNQIVFGATTADDIEGSVNLIYDGVNIISTAFNIFQAYRFSETAGQYIGGYCGYDGVNNRLEIGTHSNADAARGNDVAAFTIDRGSTDVDVVGNVTVADDAYAVGWNANLEVPTKNAVYDKIETLVGGGTIGGSILNDQIPFGAATANEIEGSALLGFQQNSIGTDINNVLIKGSVGTLTNGGGVRFQNTDATIDAAFYILDSRFRVGSVSNHEMDMTVGNSVVATFESDRISQTVGTSIDNTKVEWKNNTGGGAFISVYDGQAFPNTLMIGANLFMSSGNPTRESLTDSSSGIITHADGHVGVYTGTGLATEQFDFGADGTLTLITGFTVATLPAGVTGMRTHVTDATTPTYLGTLAGGGAIVCPVFYNGSAWVRA